MPEVLLATEVVGCDCASLRGDTSTSALDEVLRKRSIGTGTGLGLSGTLVRFERPVGLSSFGGDERATASLPELLLALTV